jgi:hypothetical protein
VDWLRRRNLSLGIVISFTIILGSILVLRKDLNYRNSFASFNYLKRELTRMVPSKTYALYDQEFRTSGCSISLSLLLDDDQRASSDGMPIGVCARNHCPSDHLELIEAEAGGFRCILVDLSQVPQKIVEEQRWVLVSPAEVHRMTVEWWKDDEVTN